MSYKQSPFPLIAGTSPVKGKLSLIKKGIKAAQKYFTKAPKTNKASTHFVKYDPKSQHLRFKTGFSSQGGKTTSEFMAVKGTPGTKNFGFDFTRKWNVNPKQRDAADVIMKHYNKP